tara:strand:+ start:161 stop:367 length:207 start_codon:yes stop_codon:yes gene_type:complete
MEQLKMPAPIFIFQKTLNVDEKGKSFLGFERISLLLFSFSKNSPYVATEDERLSNFVLYGGGVHACAH